MKKDYSKNQVIAFAEYFHRNAKSQLTIEELLSNYLKYSIRPRDIYASNKKNMNIKISNIPDPGLIIKVRDAACMATNITIDKINEKKQYRTQATARQITCHVLWRMGFSFRRMAKELDWDRASCMDRNKKCINYAGTEAEFNETLNVILEQFGLTPVNNNKAAEPK